LDATDYARQFIASGSNLPQARIAEQGATLIKVVPKGDGVSPYSGYWMSPQQAQAIATMTPEQAAQVLGLPASQAANMMKNGMDFYAISPKAGITPNVFVSNVASTTQGAVSMPGGGQQVIVSNRSQWTIPTSIDPVLLLRK
jgi:filamentous hemagglutinin